MKVAIKNKSEMKYIDSADIKVGDMSLLELANLVDKQNAIIKTLLDQIKDSHIVKKDTAYIIKIDNELKHIKKLEIVAEQDLKYPLRLYKLEDGILKLDKKKVVAL